MNAARRTLCPLPRRDVSRSTARRVGKCGRGRPCRPTRQQTKALRSASALPYVEVALSDPLARWTGGAEALPDTHFLTRALRHLQRDASDPEFTRLFWQYVRLRGIVYRHLVQEPGTAGLDWFTAHFDRISPLRGRLADGVMASALELESRTGRLESLEVPTSPASRWSEIRTLVQQIAGSRAGARKTGAGPCPSSPEATSPVRTPRRPR